MTDSPQIPERPAPPNPELVSRIALQGPVGKSLEEALQDVVGDCMKESAEQEECVPAVVCLDQAAAHRVAEAYGAAVADTKWDAAPSALLRGRVDHFNRMGGQWRLVADKTELRRRKLMKPNKKRKLNSLWDRQDEENVEGETSEVLSIPGTVQILAYDDM